MPKLSASFSSPNGKGGFDAGVLDKNIAALDNRMRRVITGQFEYHKDVATTFMKDTAPWTDRTGNARSGLFTTTAYGVGGDHWELILAHSVYYGIFLEVCNSGKYGVIQKALDYIGPLLLIRLNNSLEKIGAYNE